MSMQRIDINGKAISVVLESFLSYVKENSFPFSGCDLTDINVRSDCGDSLLHFAVRFYDEPTVLAELIELGLDVDALGDMSETPLHVAVACNNLDAVQVLVRYGARLDILSEFNSTPLDKAFDRGHPGILEYLQEHKNRS